MRLGQGRERRLGQRQRETDQLLRRGWGLTAQWYACPVLESCVEFAVSQYLHAPVVVTSYKDVIRSRWLLLRTSSQQVEKYVV
jgi:hypothetical protein